MEDFIESNFCKSEPITASQRKTNTLVYRHKKIKDLYLSRSDSFTDKILENDMWNIFYHKGIDNFASLTVDSKTIIKENNKLFNEIVDSISYPDTP